MGEIYLQLQMMRIYQNFKTNHEYNIVVNDYALL